MGLIMFVRLSDGKIIELKGVLTRTQDNRVLMDNRIIDPDALQQELVDIETQIQELDIINDDIALLEWARRIYMDSAEGISLKRLQERKKEIEDLLLQLQQEGFL